MYLLSTCLGLIFLRVSARACVVCGRAEPTQNKDIGWSALISRRNEKEKLELQVFAGVLRKDLVIRENDGREPEEDEEKDDIQSTKYIKLHRTAEDELRNRERKASGAESLCFVLFFFPTRKVPRSRSRLGGRVWGPGGTSTPTWGIVTMNLKTPTKEKIN
jgi:hypothetical protein